MNIFHQVIETLHRIHQDMTYIPAVHPVTIPGEEIPAQVKRILAITHIIPIYRI